MDSSSTSIRLFGRHWKALSVRPNRLWLVAALLLFCLGGNAWHAQVLKANELGSLTDTFPSHRCDLLPVYMATRIALHRNNPYSVAAIRSIDDVYYGSSVSPQQLAIRDLMGFAYPLPVVLLFAPLAALPWRAASFVYLLLSAASAAILGPLWMRVLGVRLPPLRYALLLLAGLACWPMVWELRVQNIVLTIAVCLASGLYALQRGHPTTAGILIALGSLKPQVTLLMVLWLIVWAIVQRRFRFVAAFVGTTLLLAAGSFALVPRWIPDWREGISNYQRYTHVWALLPVPCAVLLSLVVAAFLARSLRCHLESPEFGVAVSLCLATMVALAPFVWTHAYDYILLLPACYVILMNKPQNQLGDLLRGVSLFLISLEFVLGPISSAVELARGNSSVLNALPGLNLLLPVSLTLTLLFYQIRSKQAGENQTLTPLPR